MDNANYCDDFDAEAFMQMSLPDRFHSYMVREICSEEDYQIAMRNNGYDYLPMLYRIKKEIPVVLPATHVKTPLELMEDKRPKRPTN